MTDQKNTRPLVERLRSRGVLGFVAAAIVILALALAFFWPDAMEGNVLMQHDTQQGIAISHEVETYRDATGETPRWTNSLFSGMPTFQISPRYAAGGWIKAIESVYTLWLPSPVNLLFAMMMGFFILLMTMRVRWYLSLLGAIAYGFSSYFIIIIGAGHIWKFVTLAYIPPTIAGMVLCYRGRYLAGGAMAALFAMLQIAGNHIQMSYYFLMVVVGFAVAYAVEAARKRQWQQWFKATGALAISAVLAIGVNLPGLYNTYEYSKETMRGRHSELTDASSASSVGKTGGLSKEYITAWSYGKGETLSLLIPNVKGGATIKPEKGDNKFLSLAETPAAEDLAASTPEGPQLVQALGQMPQYFGDQPMTNGPVYVGALIMALFILGCIIVKGPVKWMLVVVTVLSIALSWGHNMMWLTDMMIDYFPMYNKFRTVASILVVAEFAIPLLAVLALQQIVERRGDWAGLRRPLFTAFGLCLAVCLLGILAPGIFGSYLSAQEAEAYGPYLADQGYGQVFAAVQNVRMSMVSADSLRSFFVIALGAILIWAYISKRVGLKVVAPALIVLVAVDMMGVDKRYLDTDSFVARRLVQDNPFPLTNADKTILADTDPHYRVLDMPRFNEAAPSYHHKTIGGYHAAKLTRYQDLIDRHLSHFITGKVNDADMNVANMLNAKYIVVSPDEAVANPEALGNAWFVDNLVFVDDADAEMEALSAIDPAVEAVADARFADALGREPVQEPSESDTISLTSYAPDRLTYAVKSAKGGLAVFSEVYFPWGWKAEVGGQELPIGRVDYLLRAIRLPAGEYELVMTFAPASVGVTQTLSIVALVLICLAALAAAAMWIKGIVRK